jgi:hypothetical protein
LFAHFLAPVRVSRRFLLFFVRRANTGDARSPTERFPLLYPRTARMQTRKSNVSRETSRFPLFNQRLRFIIKASFLPFLKVRFLFLRR